MRPSRIALFAIAFGALSACSAPASTGGTSTTASATPSTPAEFGPGDYCEDTYVLVQPTTRANFSLGSEYFRNGDYCEAYVYLRHLIATEPLYTGEDPDDRNYLRLAAVYEGFAAQVDSTDRAERIAYLDSAIATRQQGLRAMQAQGLEVDTYNRALNEGFFYFKNADIYDDASERQFEAFSTALEAQPDSLEDWYINQLYITSADQFEPADEAAPSYNPDRAAFVSRLATFVDDPTLKQFYTANAEYFATEPSVVIPGEIAEGGADTVVQGLLDDLYAGRLSGDRVLTLLATARQQPERIQALDRDPDEVQSRILSLPEITENVDDPTLLYALSQRSYRNGDRTEGNQFFDRAIANASSNAQRADFFYSRGSSRFGSSSDFTRALEYFPSHGPSLYRRAGLIGEAVGQRRDLRGRFAYWCLADIYRNVAASTTGRVRDASRRVAAQYERSGPTREQYFLEGFRPGQSVSASLGSYGSCTTRVR